MSSPLCGTGIYANDVLCEVIDNLDDLQLAAAEANDAAQTALRQLEESSTDEIMTLAGIDYEVDTSSVPTNFGSIDDNVLEPDYSGLTPEEVDLPDADEALISDETIDAIYDDAADRISRVSVKDERDASYKAASMGIGMMSAALQKLVGEATQTANERISETALKQAGTEGQWKREDAKTIHGLHLQSYSEQVKSLATYLGAETGRFGERINKYKADIHKEGERRGWSEMQIKNLLEQADKATAYALDKAKVILDINRETQQATAQLSIALAGHIYSAANYNLSGQGAQQINTNISE